MNLWKDITPLCQFCVSLNIGLSFGSYLSHNIWVTLNRLITGVGHFSSNMCQRGLRETASCICRAYAGRRIKQYTTLFSTARPSDHETPFVPAAQQLNSLPAENDKRAALWSDHRWIADWLENTARLCTFIPDIGTHISGMALPSTVWVWLNRIRTGVGRFHSSLHKWGMAHSAAFERGSDEQTVSPCCSSLPNPLIPHGVHGLTVVVDETIKWLLNASPKI